MTMYKVLSWFCGDTVATALIEQAESGAVGAWQSAFVMACIVATMLRGLVDIFNMIGGA